MASIGETYTIFTNINSTTIDAATNSQYTSEIWVQAHQRVGIALMCSQSITALGSVVAGSAFIGTVTLQRSMDAGENWFDVEDWSISAQSISDKPEVNSCSYRAGVKAGDLSDGDCVLKITTT